MARLPGMLERKALTPRRAALIISGYTLAVTLAGGVIAWVTDRGDFDTFGDAMWWSLQTVTTVGYGDVVPTGTGRVIGLVIMLSGIGFLTVITAAVTATFIESARERLGRHRPDPTPQLAEISARLAAIEARLGESPPEGDPDSP